MTQNQDRQIRRRAYTAAKIAYDCVEKAIDKLNRIEKESDPEATNGLAARSISRRLRGELMKIGTLKGVNEAYLGYYNQMNNNNESKN